MTDMSLRVSATNPGRTYKWFSGTPVFEFGHGLHFTSFQFSWENTDARTFDIQDLVSAAQASGTKFLDTASFASFNVVVQNVGETISDYVALLFLSGEAGPQPAPIKQLVAYIRLHDLNQGSTTTAELNLSLGSIARIDDSGNSVIFPGTYTLTLDTAGGIDTTFTLTGQQAQLIEWPQPST